MRRLLEVSQLRHRSIRRGWANAPINGTTVLCGHAASFPEQPMHQRDGTVPPSGKVV